MEISDIGNLFVVGFHGTFFSHELREFIDDLRPSGLILFSRNIQSPLQIASLNRDIQYHALKRQPDGVFIGTDQEGGRVRRLNAPFTVFPSALELGMSDTPSEAVRRYASVTAHELRLAGFNTNFVPVLDVLGDVSNDRGSVIGDRSYGFDPSTVSRFGKIVIECMRSGGIIECCKHFPGHGGTTIDSHHELPFDNRPLRILETRDLVPFRDAVASDVAMVMTAHVLFPALDPSSPASLSGKSIQGLLRTNMGYEGVVITDDLDMGAVAENYSTEEAALRALSAGTDLLLISNSPEKAYSARSRIYEAVKAGEVTRERVEESLRRIKSLKKRYKESLRPSDESAVRAYFGSRIPII